MNNCTCISLQIFSKHCYYSFTIQFLLFSDIAFTSLPQCAVIFPNGHSGMISPLDKLRRSEVKHNLPLVGDRVRLKKDAPPSKTLKDNRLVINRDRLLTCSLWCQLTKLPANNNNNTKFCFYTSSGSTKI